MMDITNIKHTHVWMLGVQLATLSSMAPDRKSDFAAVVFRAFISGSVACFLTACIAGTLYDQDNLSLFQDSLQPLEKWKVLFYLLLLFHKFTIHVLLNKICYTLDPGVYLTE